MQRVMLSGLVKIELPGGDVLLCDGGTLPFDGDTYECEDSVFGHISALEPMEEGVGDTAPSSKLTLVPKESASATALSSGDFQGSRVRMWIAEVSQSLGTIVGDPDLMADTVIDVTRLVIGDVRTLQAELVSRAERLFSRNKSNALNGGFHKRMFASELGLDNAAGVAGPFAWAAKSPPRGTSSGSNVKTVVQGIVG